MRSVSKRVSSVVDDCNIDVVLRTMDSYKTSTGKGFVGGAFMGNKVEIGPKGEVAKVIANQEINTEALFKADTYEHKGTSIMHELTEAYEGAKIAWKKGKSVPSPDVKYRFYNRAHRKATPQISKTLFGVTYYDLNGNTVTDGKQAVRADFYIKPSINSNDKTLFLTIP